MLRIHATSPASHTNPIIDISRRPEIAGYCIGNVGGAQRRRALALEDRGRKGDHIAKVV
jgi:hypothetical protein